MESNIKINIWVHESDLIKLTQDEIYYSFGKVNQDQIQIQITLKEYQQLISDKLLKKFQIF